MSDRELLKQALHYRRDYRALDLTDCKINRIVKDDGTVRFMVSYPKKWEEVMLEHVDRDHPLFTPTFQITEWEEVELELPSKEVKT